MKEKYVTVTIGGIITQIAKPTKTKGFTEGVLEVFLPDGNISDTKADKWIAENNKRMNAICEFLNENNL